MSVSKNTNSTVCGLLLLAVATFLAGCKSEETVKPDSTPVADVSDVPLRIWIVTELTDAAIFERQWLADSDQPIEITSMTEDDFLNRASCKCDVVLSPSRNLGDLVRRQWISPLPASVYAPASDEIESNDTPESSAHQSQAALGKQRFGVPLGCSLPVVVASAAMGERIGEGVADWPTLASQLKTADTIGKVNDAQIDPQAMVDRFLHLVGALTERNSKYGLLFELKTMESRLQEPEFRQAVEIMVELSKQPGGIGAVVGSHNAAWQWASEQADPVVAIASPAMLHGDAAGLNTGVVVAFEESKDVQGWNTGGGIVASLSAECRQTSRAAQFLRWLRQVPTRDALGPLMIGVETHSSGALADSLSWSARQSLENALNSKNVPQEPSLPKAHSYRVALAAGLLSVLQGEATVPEMLSGVDAAWAQITSEAGNLQRLDYEASLGLTF